MHKEGRWFEQKEVWKSGVDQTLDPKTLVDIN